jgi:ornithine--oxo-acid transaminase
LTYGALSVNGDAIFKDRFGVLVPGTAQVHSTISRRWRKPCRRAMSRLLSSNRLRAKALLDDIYLRGVQALCRKYGIAIEHWGVDAPCSVARKATPIG